MKSSNAAQTTFDPQDPIYTIEHVAAMLHVKVDTAPEYSYRADFPPAHQLGARLLWDREQILVWFRSLPPPDPRRPSSRRLRRGRRHRGRPAGRTGLHVSAARRPRHRQGRGMSSRCKPVKAVGEVNVLAPSAKSLYFRLTWIEPDGTQGRTTGGRTLGGAKLKAAVIDAGLQRATHPKGLTPLGQVMAEYLASPWGAIRRPGKTGLGPITGRPSRF
jgi:hypothetical protein